VPSGQMKASAVFSKVRPLHPNFILRGPQALVDQVAGAAPGTRLRIEGSWHTGSQDLLLSSVEAKAEDAQPAEAKPSQESLASEETRRLPGGDRLLRTDPPLEVDAEDVVAPQLPDAALLVEQHDAIARVVHEHAARGALDLDLRSRHRELVVVPDVLEVD